MIIPSLFVYIFNSHLITSLKRSTGPETKISFRSVPVDQANLWSDISIIANTYIHHEQKTV